MAGAWRFLATTYVDYWETDQSRDEEIHTGLILVSTLKCNRLE